MSVLVTGSVAIDQIMVFPDRFAAHILPDHIHKLNVSFPVPELERRYGGCGANIAYNLRVLGEDPILLATVGHDFAHYAEWLDRHGIRRHWLHVLPDCFTAQCFITTDLDNNQITSFHPGAMDRAHEAPLANVEADLSVAIVSPNGRRAMIELARGIKERGVPCLFDPGQALPILEAEELVEMIEGAAVFVVNDYEWALVLEKTGLDEAAVLERVGAAVVTRGERGSSVKRGKRDAGLVIERDTAEIPAVAAEAVVDPTGCGDAYRAGLLYAVAHAIPLETGARIGSLLGSLKVARSGPQSIDVDLDAFRARFESEFDHSF